MARIANAKIDPDQLMREGASSGLVRYIFADDLLIFIFILIFILTFVFMFIFI